MIFYEEKDIKGFSYFIPCFVVSRYFIFKRFDPTGSSRYGFSRRIS